MFIRKFGFNPQETNMGVARALYDPRQRLDYQPHSGKPVLVTRLKGPVEFELKNGNGGFC